MFNKILIANRGEIACRVIRTANRLGIRSVAVYSDADADALHVLMADEAVHIGGPAPADSYLRMDEIIRAAKQTGAEAIHPGYGFLSENAEFSGLCTDNGLVFIGPPATAIEIMGSKSAAKHAMENEEVPLLPGYHGVEQDAALLKQAADEIGYPVLLKAVAGGGGKGMRQVNGSDEFDQALTAAKREAQSSFGDDAMLVEKFLGQPRHVEVQVFCDSHGNGVYLFERDCSVQRRHQKIIEEAPAPGLPVRVREQMGEAALRVARAVDYVGAGTVEFLLDDEGKFFFMEMNTRLQVEHPVTELITRQDLVEWQLRVASGETLPCAQSDLTIEGHAFEARIYAEDPDNDFLPAAGRLTFVQQPAESFHVRIDTGVAQGDEVGVFYDPMIAKLIVWDQDRNRALQRLAQALSAYRIVGVTTNISFLRRLASHSEFISEDISTDFISRHRDSLFQDAGLPLESLAPIAVLYLILKREAARKPRNADPTSPWNDLDCWRMNAPRIHMERIIVNDTAHDIEVEQVGASDYVMTFETRTSRVSGLLAGNELNVTIDGHRQTAVLIDEPEVTTLFTDTASLGFSPWSPDLGEDVEHDDGTGFTAPMNGTIVEILVSVGDRVEAGDTLLIMEAMKMEHPIKAPTAGIVKDIYFAQGDLVDGGTELIAFEKLNSHSEA